MRKLRAEIIVNTLSSWMGVSAVFIEDEHGYRVVIEEVGKREEGIKTIRLDMRDSVVTFDRFLGYLGTYCGSVHIANLLFKMFVTKLMAMAFEHDEKYFFHPPAPAQYQGALPPRWLEDTSS